MKFTFAGGAMEVGGSCIYMKTGAYGILLDCGIRQGGRDPLPDLRLVQEQGGVDAILVSHAHMDHTGALPVISKAYPGAPIFMTKMTAELTRVLLFDSLKIMGRREEEIPAFAENDVLAMLKRIRPVSYQARREVLPDIYLTAYPAGHIAGAACLYIETPEGCVFYSGDISGFPQQTIPGARIPRLRPDVALLEATYGNRLHSNRDMEEKRLIDAVCAAVDRGGKVLIPAFALGRSQEVLLLLRRAMTRGLLKDIPVYVDGMVRDINRVYTQEPTFLAGSLARRIFKGQEPFYTDQIKAVGNAQDRKALFGEKGPAIFVASSGMLSGGPSTTYAALIAGQEDGCIILTGYQDEESPGRRLLELAAGDAAAGGITAGEGADVVSAERVSDAPSELRTITLDGVSMPLRCRVEQIGLSAHADRTELAGVIDRISARRVILVHGDEEAIRTLGEDLAQEPRRGIYAPACGDTIEIIIRSKRQQLRETMDFSMQRSGVPEGEDIRHLWAYWQEHYPGRSMDARQIAFLWTGKWCSDEDDAETAEAAAITIALLDSPWFTRDLRRMYLIRPCTAEEAEEAQKKSGPTIQDVEEAAREILPADVIRKLGFHQERRHLVITTDFPDVFPAAELENCRVRMQALGWTVELNTALNHNAAAVLLRGLLGDRMLRSSYYIHNKTYQVTLREHAPEDGEIAGEFLKKTGWQLTFAGAPAAEGTKPSPLFPAGEDWFHPSGEVAPMEQNLLIQCVDMTWEGTEEAPYKKGFKNDQAGRYLELAFLTPAVGRRHPELLQQLADQTGWRVHIADSPNMNEVFQIIGALLTRYGFVAARNPAWLPQQQCFRVKLAEGELPEALCREFQEITGYELVSG